MGSLHDFIDFSDYLAYTPCLPFLLVLDRVAIKLPEWLYGYEASLKDDEYETDEAMMEVAVNISARNVQEGTGGPFGCAIFEKDPKTNKAKLFAVGANRVVPLCNSTIHGEMAAIQFAEKKLKSFSLRPSDSDKQYIMCTSCEPCAMCLGGTFWAAPAEMICGATKDDAESIGFNEGPVCKYHSVLDGACSTKSQHHFSQSISAPPPLVDI